jgi:hypothetical protein
VRAYAPARTAAAEAAPSASWAFFCAALSVDEDDVEAKRRSARCATDLAMSWSTCLSFYLLVVREDEVLFVVEEESDWSDGSGRSPPFVVAVRLCCALLLTRRERERIFRSAGNGARLPGPAVFPNPSIPLTADGSDGSEPTEHQYW